MARAPDGTSAVRRPLDNIPKEDYIPNHPPHYRGRSHETQTRAGEGAAPAGEARNLALGRPWVAVRPHYGGLPESGWTRHGRRRAKACRIGSSQKPPGSAPGSYGPGTEIAAMERREAPAFSKESAARRKTGAPLGAPSPRASAEGKERGPAAAGTDYGAPAPQRTGAMARAGLKLGCLKTESVSAKISPASCS